MNVTNADLFFKIGVLTVEKDALAEENRQLRAQLEKPAENGVDEQVDLPTRIKAATGSQESQMTKIGR